MDQRSQQIENVVYRAAAALDKGASVDIDALVQEFPDLAPDLERRLRQLLNRQADKSKRSPPAITITSKAQSAKGNSDKPQIPDFNLIRVLGEGGFGTVWLGHNPLDDDYYAVKVFAKEHAVELEGVRFFQQRTKDHPMLTPILHVGTAGESYYYVMPLADDICESRSGIRSVDSYVPKTLQWCVSNVAPLPLAEVVAIGDDLLTALDALHAVGITHCDVKPANVLQLGDSWRLTDVGLMSRSSDLSASRGTREFWPPEGPREPSADIYALGKTMFLAWTGQPLSRFGDFIAGKLEIAETEDSYRAMHNILSTACAADPAERYRSASIMKDELSSVLRLQTKAKTSNQQSSLAWGRKLTRRVLGLAVCIVIFGLIGWFGWSWMEHYLIGVDADELTVSIHRNGTNVARLGGAEFQTGMQPIQAIRNQNAIQVGDIVRIEAEAEAGRFPVLFIVQPNGSMKFYCPSTDSNETSKHLPPAQLQHEFEIEEFFSTSSAFEQSSFQLVALVSFQDPVPPKELDQFASHLGSQFQQDHSPWSQNFASELWYFFGHNQLFEPSRAGQPIPRSRNSSKSEGSNLEWTFRKLGHDLHAIPASPRMIKIQAIAFPVGEKK